jgi:hypothetical protein
MVETVWVLDRAPGYQPIKLPRVSSVCFRFGSLGGKFVSSVLALLGISILGVFCFVVFRATRQLPSSHGAPTVGQKAPDFTLRDTRRNLVSLSALLSSPPEPATSGAATQEVLLIFHRGYW